MWSHKADRKARAKQIPVRRLPSIRKLKNNISHFLTLFLTTDTPHGILRPIDPLCIFAFQTLRGIWSICGETGQTCRCQLSKDLQSQS